jgi:broad specificity phosphatase PhoE
VDSARAGQSSLAVVTHGGFIQWLVRATFGVRTWMPLLPTGNCGVFELVVTPRPDSVSPHLLWKRLNFQVGSGIEAIPQVF